MSSRKPPKRRAARVNPPTATILQGLSQEQAKKIARDFRCADCGHAGVRLIKACADCDILGLEASHDPQCPVRRGLVPVIGNYLAALAA